MVERGTVWLVGMMGAGKSTVGPALARRLGRRFVDTDAEIERERGLAVAEIFARFPDLADDAAWTVARGHRELFEWVVENRVGREVAVLDDRLHSWESAAEVTVNGGERMPYQRVAIAIANEPNRERRLLLDAARRRVLAEQSPLGSILHSEGIGHLSWPQAFFCVQSLCFEIHSAAGTTKYKSSWLPD